MNTSLIQSYTLITDSIRHIPCLQDRSGEWVPVAVNTRAWRRYNVQQLKPFVTMPKLHELQA